MLQCERLAPGVHTNGRQRSLGALRQDLRDRLRAARRGQSGRFQLAASKRVAGPEMPKASAQPPATGSQKIVEGTLQAPDVLSLRQVLVQAACPVSLFVGDMERLGRFVELLLDRSARNGLEFWHAWGRCFKGVLLIRRGHAHVGLTLLRAALAELRDIQYGVYYVVFLGEYAEAWGRAGNVAQGLAAIDEALDRSERNEERWYVPELLRIKGDLVLGGGDPSALSEAEDHLQRSLALAREQQTPSWALRTALSLSRLWRDAGRGGDVRGLLAPLYASFGEGLRTEDLRAARELLDALG
jgi:hypothetical protein